MKKKNSIILTLVIAICLSLIMAGCKKSSDLNSTYASSSETFTGSDKTDISSVTSDDNGNEVADDSNESTGTSTSAEVSDGSSSASDMEKSAPESVYAFQQHTHIWSEWKTVKNATATEEGLKERYCYDCKTKETLAIGKLPTNSTTENSDSLEQQVFRLVNDERAKNGLSPLKYSNEAQAAANLRAKEIVTKFDHTRPDGRTCYTVFEDLGITSPRMAGENIAYGYSSAEAVMNGWMNSEGHRANILRASGFTGIAVGVYQNYWVQIFVS